METALLANNANKTKAGKKLAATGTATGTAVGAAPVKHKNLLPGSFNRESKESKESKEYKEKEDRLHSKPERKPLTARQREVFEFIKERIQSNSRPPTLREIGLRFDISSTNGVRSILYALAKKNYIERSPKLSRGIDLPEMEKGLTEVHEGMAQVPILGRVAAGSPMLAVENLEGTVVVDRDFLMRQENVFALKVHGDSMKDAGIVNGDLVFARQQRTAEVGQMVIALIGEETTVKYFHPEGAYIRLQPANDAFRPLIVDANMPEFSILGRVIGVMRQYK